MRRDAGVMARGAKIYDQQCAYCHGDAGQGAEGAYPPLASNRAVLMESPANLVQVLPHGGFLPATVFAIVAATGDIYSGLWYPVVIATMSFFVGLLFLPETKDVDITK